MEPLQLGDGLTLVNLGGAATFPVDLVSWVAWHVENAERFEKEPFGIPAAVIAKVKADTDGKVTLNYTQADSFMAAVLKTYNEIKKKQLEEQSWPSSTDSTPSS